MNYFRYMHGDILFYGSTIITFSLLMAMVGLLVWLMKTGKLPEKYSTPIIFIIGLPLLLGSFYLEGKIINHFTEGIIREVFVTPPNKLDVWLTRVFPKRFGADYDQRLKTFDLNDGKVLKTVQLVKKTYSSDYWYPKATGHSGYPSGWHFQYAPNSLGKRISAQGETLLKPKLIKELGKSSNKVWVVHQSLINVEKYDTLLSYLDHQGKIIKTINLNKYFAKDKVKVVATYTKPDEALIFITCGGAYYSFNSGFTLTALKTDNKSGGILGRIDYIK